MREILRKLVKPKIASAFELGKDLFGKYASADDSTSSKRRAHRTAGLNEKYVRLQQRAIPKLQPFN